MVSRSRGAAWLGRAALPGRLASDDWKETEFFCTKSLMSLALEPNLWSLFILPTWDLMFLKGPHRNPEILLYGNSA